MYGMILAFKKYNIAKGILGSEWVGLKYFKLFFKDYKFWIIVKNTFILSFYQLFATIPIPIIFALCLNYLRNKYVKKSIQMVTYAPHFISYVVLVGLVYLMFSPTTGIFTNFLKSIGIKDFDILSNGKSFRHLYVFSEVWQNVGYRSIIYLSALSTVDNSLHEAAVMDGASKFRRMISIDFPALIPPAIVLLTLNAGRILNMSFEKILLMQNDINIGYSETIPTYVYKVGLKSAIPQFSYSTAIGIFQSVVGIVLIYVVNALSDKFAKNSLW